MTARLCLKISFRIGVQFPTTGANRRTRPNAAITFLAAAGSLLTCCQWSLIHRTASKEIKTSQLPAGWLLLLITLHAFAIYQSFAVTTVFILARVWTAATPTTFLTPTITSQQARSFGPDIHSLLLCSSPVSVAQHPLPDTPTALASCSEST